MSKELEAFETVYNNIDYLISDVVIEDNEVSGCLMTIKEQLLTIKQALINYTNITKQIEEADYKSAIGLLVKVKDNLDSYTYNTILEALLKAQEPKQYLKWEDLEFNIDKQMMTVLLNGTKYTLILGRNVHIDKLAFLKNGEINYYFLEADKQFFNDLRLEMVEE